MCIKMTSRNLPAFLISPVTLRMGRIWWALVWGTAYPYFIAAVRPAVTVSLTLARNELGPIATTTTV